MEDALNRPWERSGRFLASRMPDGTTEPDETVADLDQWRLRHLEENDGARHNARHDGIEDRMVSANLPEHIMVTEMNSVTRTAAYLIERGSEATEVERVAYESRKRASCHKFTALQRWKGSSIDEPFRVRTEISSLCRANDIRAEIGYLADLCTVLGEVHAALGDTSEAHRRYGQAIDYYTAAGPGAGNSKAAVITKRDALDSDQPTA